MSLAAAFLVALAFLPPSGQNRQLEQANERWAGVRCRLRIAIPLLHGTDLNGWTGSRFVKTGGSSGGKVIKVGFGVGDRKALSKAGVVRDNRLPEGTEFLALGWRFRNPGKARELMLEMRFADVPVQALVRFEAGDNVEDLPAIEQVLRAEVFEMPEEQVAASAPAAAKPPTKPAPVQETSRQQTAQPEVFNPTVRILGASVNPARASRGAEIELLIHYAIESLPEGLSFEVVERRGLRSGDTQLGTFEEKMPRSAGTYSSTQKIRVPDNMAPGVYTFEATVTLAGKTATTTALFEVR